MKIDRLMRSFSEGVVFIKFLLDNDVKIISVSEEINTESVSGKFYVNLLLSLSELERNTIVERYSMGTFVSNWDKALRLAANMPFRG